MPLMNLFLSIIKSNNAKHNHQNPSRDAGGRGPSMSIHEVDDVGDIEVVKQQLTAGADVYTKDDHENTPQHNAAMEGHHEVAELLIAKGTDVNTTNDDGESLLKLATFPETDSLLRKLGAKTGEELNTGD